MATEQRLRLIHEAIFDMYRSVKLADRLGSIARSTRELESADASAVMLTDEEAGGLVVSANDGLSDAYASRQRIPTATALKIYQGPDKHVILDLRSAAAGDQRLIRAEGLVRVLAVPLAFAGELIGALNVYTKDPAREFDADDIEIAHILASAAAIGITNARLYADAIRQQEMLAETEKERQQFLSIVSHELRTPLTPLKAMAQLLRSRVRRHRAEGAPLDLDSLDRNLATIERQVDRMNGLVNDLLSVSRAERGALQLERAPFDLAGLLRDVVSRYQAATAEEGRHRFAVNAPDRFAANGDQSRIEQLLMNLVGNAVKYSPYGGEISVSLADNGGTVEIATADHGIGIPEEDLGRLGHPFVRGSGRAATFAGMGVGLYVARLVAEGHGGQLALESDGDEKGTIVRVTLPP